MVFASSDLKLSFLAQSWLFQAATSGDREWLAPRCTVVRYRRGARIVGRGVAGQFVYVVGQGRVKGTLPSPTAEGEFVIALLWPGDTFGEASVLDEAAAFGNAMAMTDVQLLAVPRADLLEVLKRRPELMLRLIGAMADKLRMALDLNLSLRFLDIPARLYRRLLYLARFDSRWETDGLVIRHGLSQLEMADSIGASREALNKVIAEWKREGLVDWRRGNVVIRDTDALTRRMPDFVRADDFFGVQSLPGQAPRPVFPQFGPHVEASTRSVPLEQSARGR